MSAHRVAALEPPDAQQGPPTPSSMSTSPTNSSKKRPRDESTETGTADDRKQKRTSSATASQHSAQSSRDGSRSTHGKSSESKTGPTDRRHHARRTRRTDTEDTQEAPAAQSAEVLRSIQSQITTTNPSPAEQGHEKETIGAQNMDEDHGEADDNPEDAAEQDQDAVAAHPPSEGEEEEINKGVVPDYVRREIEEFEQGFNGLQGRFKLLDKIGEGKDTCTRVVLWFLRGKKRCHKLCEYNGISL